MSNVNKARPLPSVEYLNECFEYDSETGSLTWRERPVSRFKTISKDGKLTAEVICKRWNTRYSGQEAGRITQGYRAVRIDTVSYRVHRIAYKMHTGLEPTDTIDHINGDPLDNRACNLRLATVKEQTRNRSMSSNNVSGYVGVCLTEAGTWVATGWENGKRVYIGRFKCVHEAGEAAKQYRINKGYSDRHGTN